jgi:hypothetical protein
MHGLIRKNPQTSKSNGTKLYVVGPERGRNEDSSEMGHDSLTDSQRGIKILDPQWQTSTLLVKLLIRGFSVGYEPWKVLVRYRVSQTKQSRRGKWPAHSN